jgi:hypothetical protein
VPLKQRLKALSRGPVTTSAFAGTDPAQTKKFHLDESFALLATSGKPAGALRDSIEGGVLRAEGGLCRCDGSRLYIKDSMKRSI